MNSSRPAPEKILWKHAYAMAAMQSALLALDAIEEAHSAGAEHLLDPLWTAFFISYGRPFTANREIGSISTRHVLPEHRSTHRVCISARNEVFGHTDPTVEMDEGGSLHEVLLQVRGPAVVPISRIPSPSPEEWSRMRALVESVHESLGYEIARNLTAMPEVQTLPNGLYSIDYSAPAGRRLIKVED